MVKPIFSSIEHKLYVEEYLKLILSFVKESSSEVKYNSFVEVVLFRSNRFDYGIS